jgi:diguanylate cyclase (GGDEF)-like protein
VTTRRRPAWLGWLTSWRAFILLAVVAIGGGGLGVRALQRQIETRALQSLELSSRLITSLVVRRNVDGPTLRQGRLAREGRLDMDLDVAELRKHGDLVGLEVWLPDGRLLYADPGHPASETTLDPAELAQARRGIAVQPSLDQRDRPSIDVVDPYRLHDGTDVDAVVEVLLPRDPINDTIARWTAALYAGAGGIVLLAALALWAIRRRHRGQEHAARHDPLTGLGNRALLAERADAVLSAATADRPAALLLLDLDEFKQINDTLGHHAGDELLVVVAHRLRAASRDADTVVRMGGDEFAVLLPDLPGPDAAGTVAQHLVQALRQPFALSGLSLEVGASIGVALAPQHGTDLATLLRQADVAMYDGKRDGAGVVVYDPGVDRGRARSFTVLAELRRAITDGQLRLHYQPTCDADGRVDRVEALVRWQHPDRGLLAPAEFVPLAERTSLVRPLTDWVLREAARQCAAWRAAGHRLTVAVNVSPRNLLHDDLPEMVATAAAAAGLPVSALQIEITETAVMTNPDRVAAVIAKLRSMGVVAAIDDFGAGFTSLSHLSTLPVHELKIDRRFVTHLLDDPTDEAVVRSVIHLARDLGLVSLAEGVESDEVWTRLTELGCDRIQGYALSRPLPPDELIGWFEAWGSARLATTVRLT